MSQKKTTTKRRSWAAIKRAKAGGAERRKAYREAKEAFALAERVRQARVRRAECSARNMAGFLDNRVRRQSAAKLEVDRADQSAAVVARLLRCTFHEFVICA